MNKYIEMVDITKTFPGVKALSSVSFSVEKGEIHAIVGKNGAGKSTLMKILGGVYSADRGEIYIDGKNVNIRSVKDSTMAGISVIFQEFNLMNELTVAENIFVDKLPKTKVAFLVRYAELKKRTIELMNHLNIDLDPLEYVKNLSVSQKQMVEIAKALSHNSEIIIMDEPTATLTNKEVDKLYEIIHMLKSENKTILYISHRMKEIFDISDRVTVLRDGHYVGTEITENVNNDIIVKMMVGRDITNYYHTRKHRIGETVLKIKSFNKKNYFENVNIAAL
ncbi:MAG: ATP-binding cassette domain-containing protein [Christensenellales bacterium]